MPFYRGPSAGDYPPEYWRMPLNRIREFPKWEPVPAGYDRVFTFVSGQANGTGTGWAATGKRR